jgi:hypothetical protein
MVLRHAVILAGIGIGAGIVAAQGSRVDDVQALGHLPIVP